MPIKTAQPNLLCPPLQAARDLSATNEADLLLIQDQLDSSQSLNSTLSSAQEQLREATQRAESLSADLKSSQAETQRLRQEFDEQVEELQQQLQGQAQGAEALLQRALAAEASSSQVGARCPVIYAAQYY